MATARKTSLKQKSLISSSEVSEQKPQAKTTRASASRKTSSVASLAIEEKKPIIDKVSVEQAQDNISRILHKKSNSIRLATVEDTEYVPKDFVVVVDTEGNVHQEPVPTYCDFMSFCYLLASVPDVPDNTTFNFHAELTINEFKDCQIVMNCYDGLRKQNPFAHKFGLKNSTKAVGGNLVLIGKGKALTKKGAEKVAKFALSKVQQEETFSV